MKSLARVLAFDDGAFVQRSSKKALLVGVLSRLDNHVEGIVSDSLVVDGWNATQKMVSLIRKTRFGLQAKLILLSGITFAGFNTIDIRALSEKTGKPVIVVLRKKPEFEKIKVALQKLSNSKKRWNCIERAGIVFPFNSGFFQCTGIPPEEAQKLLEKLCLHGNLPEPIRLAHLVASGVSVGESTRPK